MNRFETQQTLLVIMTGLLILSVIFHWHVLVYVALAIGLIALISPALSRLIHRLWFGLAKVLGWINTRILLSLVFFVLLLPLALFHRLFAKNPLQLKEEDPSLFHHRDKTYTKKDLEQSW